MVTHLDFREFNPAIGTDGYFEAIRALLHPRSTLTSTDVAALRLHTRTYPKGSIFSRVRPIRKDDADKFLSNKIGVREFFPPLPNIAKTGMGRFNVTGERKLYLADHPYVALRECNIHEGDFFLYSYFSFNNKMRFIEANSAGSEVGRVLNELFLSKDDRFYDVINRVYKSYLEQYRWAGVAYESARVSKGEHVEAWGRIGSSTNLAISEPAIADTEMVGGWLAQCGAKYQPIFMKMFSFYSNPKKRRRLSGISYRGNEREFLARYSTLMTRIHSLKEQGHRSADAETEEPVHELAVKFRMKDQITGG